MFFVDQYAVATFLRHALVAVGPAPRSEAAFKLPAQASMRLLAQVIEVQLVHQPPRDAHHLAAVGL
ncbi:hypothetical protein ABL839_28290 [Variovorax atrisoli 110B]|nr:hypothetical protein [Variovorax paradoxus]